MTAQNSNVPPAHPPAPSGSSTGLIWVVALIVWALAKFFSGGGDAKPVAAADQDRKVPESAEKYKKILEDKDYANRVVDAYRPYR
jgi:hypothetical protein